MLQRRFFCIGFNRFAVCESDHKQRRNAGEPSIASIVSTWGDLRFGFPTSNRVAPSQRMVELCDPISENSEFCRVTPVLPSQVADVNG